MVDTCLLNAAGIRLYRSIIGIEYAYYHNPLFEMLKEDYCERRDKTKKGSRLKSSKEKSKFEF